MTQLKYQQTPDGVHVWRYPDGNIFCAASGSQKEGTTCYPLAKQFVEGASASLQPSPTPNPLPAGEQSGDPLSLLLLLGAIVCCVVGGVALSYVLAPVSKPDPSTPTDENPLNLGRSGREYSLNDHLADHEQSTGVREQSNQHSHEETNPKTSQEADSKQVQKPSYAQIPLQIFKETVPAGVIDPRTLALAEYRELGKETIWRFYTQHGVTNREKLAWILTGATKGGSQAWTLTNQFLSEVCPILFQWGYTSKRNSKVSDGGF